MTNSLATMAQLLEEIAQHLKAGAARDRSQARKKLERVTALASTMALMLEVKR